MKERIVLIFAYHFPPETAIGGARPYRFYRYLSQMGYRCHVITAAKQITPGDPDVEYVPDPFEEQPRKGIGWQVERALRKFLLPGVTGIRWSRQACRLARIFLRSNPSSEITIFSTFPPLGAHLAAFQLIRKAGLRWIADFRDPLQSDPGHTYMKRLQHKINRRIEQSFLKSADVIIANTDTMAEKWQSTYPDIGERIHVIWNGFDPEDRIEPWPLPVRSFKLISHVGELYRGRSITALLESISRLIDARRIEASRIRVLLVGLMESDCLPPPQFLKRAEKEGWLELISEQVPQRQARLIGQTSDVLLLVQPHSSLQVPGKLFEYLRLARPILAYILPGTPIERILKQSGVTYGCVYAGSSAQDMDNAINSFFHLKADVIQANSWFEQNFNAKRQTQALEMLIRSLHGP